MRKLYYLQKVGKYYKYKLSYDSYYYSFDKIVKLKNETGKVTTKSRAENLVQWYIYEYLQSEVGPLKKTLHDFLEPYYVWDKCPHIKRLLDEGRSYSKEYAKDQRRYIVNHIMTDRIAKQRIDELTRGDLIDLRSRLLKKRTVSFANNAMKALKTVLREGFFRGELSSDITLGVGNIKKDVQEAGIFTLEELERLFIPGKSIWYHDQTRMAFLLSASAGLRKSEVLALRWKFVDFDTHLIYVRESVKRFYPREIGLPKWEKIRDVPMTIKLEDELKVYKRVSKQNNDENLVICWDDGTPIRRRTWNDWFARGLKRAKIDKQSRHLRPHSFRHSCITHMLQSGIPKSIVQSVAGHSTEKVTDGYTHYEPKYLVGAVRQTGDDE